MRAICVDDEPLVLNLTVSMCRELPQLDDVQGFSRSDDALAWLENNTADVALLDIDMPDMNGLQLAAKIKERCDATRIIFVTGYSQYAVDAFSLRASGYLLKPLSRDRLAEEVSYALGTQAPKKTKDITVQTFGSFAVQVEGRTVSFRRAKARELLAYLIDRQGGSVTRAQAFAVLWEDRAYDRSMQKQFDVILRSLRDTLNEYGIEEIMEIKRGVMRIRPETIDCDLYRFLRGDAAAIKAYRGEYMSSYSWASVTEAYMTQTQSTFQD